jgi:4-hydroxy-3-methylbut-2-en-1-yl diphosphate synthase IspG/GcpE
MRIGFFLLNVCFLLLINCGDNKLASEYDTEENTSQQPVISAKAIEGFKYTDYVLSQRGEKAVTDWEKYQELAIQIDYLKKADLSFFNGDKELLKKFIEEFKAQMPSTLKTNPIISRTAIIETTLLRLHENLTLDNIENQLKLESVKEVLIAFSNLNYQINKKLERDLYEQIKSEF